MALVAILLGTVGWVTFGPARSGGGSGGALLFTVRSRSFPIVLKEKGELRAARSTDIKSEVEGRATIIWLIAEGSIVEKGDLLVELASDEIENRIQSEELREANAIASNESAKSGLEIQRDRNESDIRKANLQIELKQLALDKYTKGDWPLAHKDAEVAIEQATIALKRRQEDWGAAEQLYAKEYITKTEYDEAEFDLKKAEWELAKANTSLEVLEEYTHRTDFEQKKSDLDEAKKKAERIKKNADAEEANKVAALEARRRELKLTRDQLAKFRRQREKCRIIAPSPGFVIYGSGSRGGRHFMGGSEDQIKEGASIRERQVLMSLPDTSEMVVSLRIHEAKISKLELGQRVFIDVEGLPGKRFTGEITKIAMLADTQNRWLNPDLKEFETEITLDSAQEELKPGATAHVEILISRVDDALAVPVQAVFTKGGQQYLFKYSGGELAAVKVALGQTSTEWAEITSGLSAGDRIKLAVDDDERRLLPDDAPNASKSKGARGTSPRRSHSSAAQGDSKRAPSASPASYGGGDRRGRGDGRRGAGGKPGGQRDSG